jgi:hypothetical protein
VCPTLTRLGTAAHAPLELKAPGGRLTDNQRATHSAMIRTGAQVVVADNLDDALDLLEGWELLRGDDDVKLCLTMRLLLAAEIANGQGNMTSIASISSASQI